MARVQRGITLLELLIAAIIAAILAATFVSARHDYGIRAGLAGEAEARRLAPLPALADTPPTSSADMVSIPAVKPKKCTTLLCAP